MHAIAPFKDALVVEALAWTPGTNGAVTASVVQLVPPTRPTKDELARYFDEHRATVKGKIVMVGRPTAVPVTIQPPPKRREDNDVRSQYNPANRRPPRWRLLRLPVPPIRNLVPPGELVERIDQFLLMPEPLDASTMRAANTARFARSTIAPSMSRRRCPPS